MSMFRWILLLLVLASSGCEVGHRWFSMSSDSPMPWFGFDLMPRRRTTQILPPAPPAEKTHQMAAQRRTVDVAEHPPAGRVWSKELHLPSIPAFFDTEREEELSFHRSAGARAH